MEEKQSKETIFLIVGAGMAGLVLGLQLRRQGLKVQIVERLKQQLRPVCGEYLSPQGVEYLNHLGLSHLLTPFERVDGMVIFSPSETQVSTTFPLDKHGAALNRQVFQEKLVQEFEKLGEPVLYGEAVDAIESEENGYTVRTTSLVIKTHFLIGADGRQSKVAKLLHFKNGEQLHKKVALHCYLRPKKDFHHKGQMHILPGGSYIGLNPISKDEVNFSIVTTHNAIKEAGGVKELINYWISQRKELKNQFELLVDEEIKTTSPITRSSLEINKGHAVLIGDASGFIDPLTGEGMTTAIKTACILAEEIRKNQNTVLAFNKYASRRKNDFREKEKLNFAFQRIICSRVATEIIARALNLSVHLKNTFIGVVGNIFTPKEAIKVLFHCYFKRGIK